MTTPGHIPAHFIPTLTEVVPEAAPAPPPTAEAAPAAVVPTPVGRSTLPEDFEEYVVHRVMQRIDLALEERLREAIARVTLEQTRSLVPRLREEVETVVRQSVYEAVAQELAAERHKP